MNFKTNTEWTQCLSSVFQNQSHADVILICEGKKLFVHSTILASISPFLNHILVDHKSPEMPKIILEGFRYSALLCLVNFFYSGVVLGSSEELVSISKYAKELNVNGLVNSGSANTLKLGLLEKKNIVTEQLDQMDDQIDSDCDYTSDEDVEIVFEKNTSQKSDPTESKVSSGKRPVSPNASTAAVKKKSLLDSQCPTLKRNSTTSQQKVSEEKAVKCPICKEFFPRKPLLKAHLFNVHLEVLTCKICNKVFSAPSSLKTHLKNHVIKYDTQLRTILPSAILPDSPNLAISAPFQ